VFPSGSPAAPFALMRSLSIVLDQPWVKIDLKFLYRLIDLLTQRHLIKLIQNRFMESLTDAIGLRRSDLGFSVLNIV
jgi:hypothetical protein